MTAKYIQITKLYGFEVKKMPEWKYTNKKVTKGEAQKSFAAVKSACFHCETHSSDCPISGTAGEIKGMMEVKT